MAKEIKFVKMVGTGNDFIMIDNRNKNFPADVKLISSMCDRRNGIGSDGIIIIEKSLTKDFKMRIINPDGSEVEMCGNGARCAVKYAEALGMIKGDCTVETLAGELEAKIIKKDVKLNMGKPKEFHDKFKIKTKDKVFDSYFVNTGVPHVVIFVDDVKSIDVKKYGALVRYHEMFKPKGTNCNFVEITGSKTINVRTYERGVEDETFSCGTGTCAAAICSVLYKGLKWPIRSKTPLNEILSVDSKMTSAKPDNFFYLQGEVKFTFSGIYEK